jgi:hypothetical protein
VNFHMGMGPVGTLPSGVLYQVPLPFWTGNDTQRVQISLVWLSGPFLSNVTTPYVFAQLEYVA